MKIIYLNWFIPIPKIHDKYIFWNKYTIVRENIKPHKWYFWHIHSILDNFLLLLNSNNRKLSDIQILDWIIWCFFLNKNKKNFIVIHSFDIWIWIENTIKMSNSKIKKYIMYFLDFTLWKYIKYKIKKFDCIFTTTHDRYEYIKNHISSKVEFLPCIIDTHYIWTIKKDNEINKIFCPERCDLYKWLEFRKILILEIKKILPNYIFEFIHIWNDLDNFKKWLNKNNIKVTWINYLKKNELEEKIVNSDLIIWIFNNWSLSITNIQTMLLKTAIITYDKWGIIKKEKNELIPYLNELCNNNNFRKNEILKNYIFAKYTYWKSNFKKVISTYL